MLGLPLALMPAVALGPRWALSVGEAKARVGGAVSVSARSSLVLDGDVTLRSLALDGALVLTAAAGVSVEVDCAVANRGWEFAELDDGEECAALPEAIRIRGYRLLKHEALELCRARLELHEERMRHMLRLQGRADAAEAVPGLLQFLPLSLGGGG